MAGEYQEFLERLMDSGAVPVRERVLANTGVPVTAGTHLYVYHDMDLWRERQSIKSAIRAELSLGIQPTLYVHAPTDKRNCRHGAMEMLDEIRDVVRLGWHANPFDGEEREGIDYTGMDPFARMHDHFVQWTEMAGYMPKTCTMHGDTRRVNITDGVIDVAEELGARCIDRLRKRPVDYETRYIHDSGGTLKMSKPRESGLLVINFHIGNYDVDDVCAEYFAQN